MAMLAPSFGQPGVSVCYQPKKLLCAFESQAVVGVPSSLCPVLSVEVPPASIHHIFAHRQWRAGMLMSDALLTGAFPIKGRAVLELGAGTGLPSLTACHVGGATIIVCSDYDEPHLVRVLKANVAANLPANVENARSIKVVGHIWGTNPEDVLDLLPMHPMLAPKFDVVLLADCLWDPLSHAALLKTVVSTLAHTGSARVHVIAGLHTGREKITSFVRRAYRTGLVLAPISIPSAWPAVSPTFAHVRNVHVEGNEPFVLAEKRILELEVGGTEQPTDPPRLTGLRRPFLIDGYGHDDEGDVQKRNRWLTVWSLMWAAHQSHNDDDDEESPSS